MRRFCSAVPWPAKEWPAKDKHLPRVRLKLPLTRGILSQWLSGAHRQDQRLRRRQRLLDRATVSPALKRQRRRSVARRRRPLPLVPRLLPRDLGRLPNSQNAVPRHHPLPLQAREQPQPASNRSPSARPPRHPHKRHGPAANQIPQKKAEAQRQRIKLATVIVREAFAQPATIHSLGRRLMPFATVPSQRLRDCCR